MKLTKRQLGTVLAALRLWQETLSQVMLGQATLPRRLFDIATDNDDFEMLSADEIDLLCGDLNGE